MLVPKQAECSGHALQQGGGGVHWIHSIGGARMEEKIRLEPNARGMQEDGG